MVWIEHANCNVLQLLLPVPCSFKKYHFTSCYLVAKHANDTSAPLGTFHTRLYAGQHSSCSNLQLRPVKWSPTQALKKLIWCFLHSYLPMTTPQTSFFFQYGLVLLSSLTSDVWTVWKHVFTQKSSEALLPVVCQPCQYWTSGHCEEKELSHVWQEIRHLTTTRGFLHTKWCKCFLKRYEHSFRMSQALWYGQPPLWMLLQVSILSVWREQNSSPALLFRDYESKKTNS